MLPASAPFTTAIGVIVGVFGYCVSYGGNDQHWKHISWTKYEKRKTAVLPGRGLCLTSSVVSV
jgi:hypothetical protein